MKPVRVAVIGAGYWGPNLIRKPNQLEEAELTAICDRDPARLDHIRSRFPGINTTHHLRIFSIQMLKQSLSLPQSLHTTVSQWPAFLLENMCWLKTPRSQQYRRSGDGKRR
jgi:hypothetical protein